MRSVVGRDAAGRRSRTLSREQTSVSRARLGRPIRQLATTTIAGPLRCIAHVRLQMVIALLMSLPRSHVSRVGTSQMIFLCNSRTLRLYC